MCVLSEVSVIFAAVGVIHKFTCFPGFQLNCIFAANECVIALGHKSRQNRFGRLWVEATDEAKKRDEWGIFPS